MSQPPPFKPLNPWGRAMPRVKKAAVPDPLYQVIVETAEGKEVPASPRFGGPDGLKAAEQICEAVNTAIIKRIRPEWMSARIQKYAFVPH